MKKTKKALALALALAIAGTTNLSGLENVVKVEAATSTTSGSTVIDDVEWGYYRSSEEDTLTIFLKNGTSLGEGIKDVTIPTNINNIQLGKLSTVNTCNVKSFTIPSGIDISNNAFSNAAVETIYYQNSTLQSNVFNQCNVKNLVLDGTTSTNWFAMQDNKYLETLEIKNSESFIFSLQCFERCKNLKTVTIDNTVKTVTIGTQAFELCANLSEFNCNATDSVNLVQRAFGNCVKLSNVEFNCNVNIVTSQQTQYGPYCDTNIGGAFFNCFEKETDEKGNIIKKSLIFNKDVVCTDSNDGKYNTEVIEHCSGLTDVIFNGYATLTDNFFFNCESLTNIEFNSKAVLGNALFKGIPIETLDFKSYVITIGETNRTIDTNPFDECQAKTLIFEDVIQTTTIANMPNLETLYFGDTVGVIGFGIVGNDGNIKKIDCGVNLKNCDYLKSIIIYETDLLLYDDHDALNDKLKYFRANLKNNIPTIYGLGYKDAVDNYVETWAYKNNFKYSNIISELKADYDNNNPIIGNNLTSTDIDTSKINVTAKLQPVVTNIFKKINFSDFNFTILQNQGFLTIPLKNENADENTGFTIGEIPTKLENSCNTFYVYYSGIEKECFIYTENKTPISINVNWNDTAISNLVADQPITLATVASGATITYNDNTTQAISNDVLVLDKTTTTLGDNIFTISLKENETIKEEKTFTIKENYITAIKAEYNSDNTIYVGDKIDTSKIKVTPIYKYDEDQTVNRDIAFTKLSQSQLTKEGANEITVYYNDLETTMVVSAAAVVPTNIYAMFDTNCKYYEGQENIDPKSILVTIEYNNGSQKTGADISYAYEVTKIQAGTTTIQAKVSYAGLERVIEIPVTPREITGIKASANIASATEGTTLSKTIIDKIEITYNNGKTETLDASTIDYNSLTFNHYVITANIQNTITINYAGKTSEITIWGVSNSVTRIYAEYIGSGQIVGTQIPTSDVAVHAINANGQITNITEGILLENGIPYNVGPNTVTIHYGSFSCTIIVTGLPVPAATSAPSINLSATEAPATSEPVQTNKPVTTVTETPSSTTVVSTPNTANSAPIVTNSPITINANNNKITTATNETYKIYTNKNVVLTINAVSASAIKYQVVTKGTNVSDTAWKDVTNNKIIVSKTKKPSIVYIQYTDANGMVQTIHTNGFTIDKKKATVNVKKNKTYKTGKKVTFKDASGIKSAKLDGKKIKSGVKVQKKGTHTLVVTDKAGNKTTIKFKVK